MKRQVKNRLRNLIAGLVLATAMVITVATPKPAEAQIDCGWTPVCYYNIEVCGWIIGCWNDWVEVLCGFDPCNGHGGLVLSCSATYLGQCDCNGCS